jgi:hypothetical protein
LCPEVAGERLLAFDAPARYVPEYVEVEGVEIYGYLVEA